ncbi:MAG: diaminopimelate decarboxylase [bacterium]
MSQAFDTRSRFFAYRDGRLFAENTSLDEIAAAWGTPTYVYSLQAILTALQDYQRGLKGLPHLVAFAVKANGNVAILRHLGAAGAGADLTSAGELHAALKAGIPADRMIFSGVGKTDDEIVMALRVGILMLNIESEPELETIARLAAGRGLRAPIAIRVNPNVDPKTHPKISTGLKQHKFGVPWEQARKLYEKAAGISSLEIQGIAAHIGSSLMDTAPLLQALDLLLEFRQYLQNKGIAIPYLDLGGGLGIQYENLVPETPSEYSQKLKQRIKDSGVTLILEPGRSIVGNGGILLTKVAYVKKSDDNIFVVVDAGMNSLARPAIYGAYHHIVPVVMRDGAAQTVDVVGPICESSDVFGKNRHLPPCQAGDLLAICSAGAYGYSMASNYNGQPRPAEVLVDGGHGRLIRRRETLDDMLRNQVLE